MFKFNNGMGAILCDECSVIIKEGISNDIPSTMTPEDYFKYVCTDDVAKEMFEKYVEAIEDERVCVEERDLIIDRLESEVGDLNKQIEDLEADVYDLQRLLDSIPST